MKAWGVVALLALTGLGLVLFVIVLLASLKALHDRDAVAPAALVMATVGAGFLYAAIGVAASAWRRVVAGRIDPLPRDMFELLTGERR